MRGVNVFIVSAYVTDMYIYIFVGVCLFVCLFGCLIGWLFIKRKKNETAVVRVTSSCATNAATVNQSKIRPRKCGRGGRTSDDSPAPRKMALRSTPKNRPLSRNAPRARDSECT